MGLVLLDLRSIYKPDIDCSSSELLYGTTIRLPDELFEDFSPDVPQTEYSKQLTKFMSLQSFIPRRSQPAIRSFLDPALDTCTPVFVKVDVKKAHLYPHYEGPFIIVEKRPKYFVLLMNGRVNSVSINRLKVAHLPRVAVSGCSPPNDDDVPTTSQYVHSTDNPPSSLTDELQRDHVQRTDESLIFTRRRRQVRRPVRFRD